ncbi:hypothetical protein OSB04_030019 [Centaurea solstitialis]|uniref:Transposase n=1 Tax=Centaurea solstitialis TaxID=347529 RepID=A0AA38SJT9_9ASTR|nr:hypothetical protein OSB04_030019 [Centaurea solstitialis]
MDTTLANTSQSNGASSSLKKNKRGPTRGVIVNKVRKKMGGARLTVEFSEEFRQAVGPNSEKFNNECGIILREESPFEYMDWRKVPKSVKANLRERILINFDVDLSSKIVTDVINYQMGRSFKNHRSKLQEHFIKCHGDEDVERAKRLKPTNSNIKDDAWHKLCDYWSSEKFLAMSQKNSESRAKRKYVALNGTVSTPNHYLRNRELSDDPSIGEIETFRKLHYRETEGWVNDYSCDAYEHMVEIKEHTRSIEDPPDDLEIMQHVLGKRSSYIKGWSRVPSTKNDSTNRRPIVRDDPGSSSGQSSDTEMPARLALTESELALTKSELASTKSELDLTKSELSHMKDEMAELRQMVTSMASGRQPLPTFSTSVSAQDHGVECPPLQFTCTKKKRLQRNKGRRVYL